MRHGRTGIVTAAGRRTAVFLAVCLLYFRYRLEPHLLSCAGSIVRVFLYGTDPLWTRDQLALPAGPLVLGCNWLGSWLYLPWVGPLLMTGAVAGLMLVTQQVADRLAGRRVAGVRFGPALLAVVIFNSQHLQLVVVLAVVLAGAAAAIYLRLPESKVGWRAAWVGVSLPLLLYLGAGSCLIMLACVVAIEWRSEQRRLLALLAIVYGEALPWLLTVLKTDRPIASTYLDLIPLSRLDGVVAVAVATLWLFLPVMAWWLPSRAALPVKEHRYGWPALALSMLLAGWLGFNPYLRELLLFNYAYQHHDWPRVVALAEAMPPERQGPFVAYAYLRAKYETGRLPEDMLRIRQSRYSLFLHANPNDGVNVVELRTQSYLLLGDQTLQLGLINEAEHDALEAIEVYGPAPQALETLAKVYLVKGWHAAATVVLQNLRVVPGWRRRAETWLAVAAAERATAGASGCAMPVDDAGCPAPLADVEPAIAEAVAEVSRLRSVRQRVDRRKLITKFPEAATDLLTSNPSNRMAFEYLMTCYLLDARPDIAIHELPRLQGLGYRRMPTLYQEAVLVYETVTGNQVDRCGYTIESAVRERFERFLKACDIDADELTSLVEGEYSPTPALRHEFGDTYYFYLVFRGSGLR